jgi:hypothetical protein
MSSEEGLKRMDATHGAKTETGIPAPPPGRPDDEDTKYCVELLEQLKEMHNKYKNIVDKIKSGYNQLFLIKCGTSKGNYHFLAKYKSDTYNQYFQDEQTVFSSGTIPDPCSQDQLKNFETLEKMKEHYNKIPPSLFYTVEHKTYGAGDNQEQLNLAPKYFQYDAFKDSIIPIEEAFMYKEMRNEPLKILGYNSEVEKAPALPALPPGVNGANDGMEILDIEDIDYEENGFKVLTDEEANEFARGGKKKKKKRRKRSRSKKRKGRRKNRTKKN